MSTLNNVPVYSLARIGVFIEVPAMLKTLIKLYFSILNQLTWQPNWLLDHTPDKEHFHRRRFTKKYKHKLRIVRNLWFIVSVIVLVFPALPFAVSAFLLTTFLSFSILDETA